MAQRTVHYVLGQLLAERCGLDEVPRFLFGSLLPDAVADKAERDASHYVFRGGDGTRYYDFERFRREFPALLVGDPLYLGYYMHLVEDNFYRDFCHAQHRLWFISEEEVRALHRDYHLLNPHLTQRFRLKYQALCPPDLDAQPLSRVARFDPVRLEAELQHDLSEQPEGRFSFLRPAMIDDFIAQILPDCEKELRCVLAGGRGLRAADFAWKRPQP